jgi:O-antigen ligase
MVWGIVTIVTLADKARGSQRVAGVALLLLFAVLLIGSQCSTGIAIAALLALIFPILSWCRAKHSLKPALLVVFIFATALLAGVSAGLGPDDLYAVAGRDATLTGRTDLWDIAVEAIGERPVLGYGYKEFWNPDGSSDRYKQVVGWEPSSSHNGFVEVALDLGLVGETALVLVLILGVSRAVRMFWRGTDRLSAWPLCVMIFVICSNLTEASFAKYQTITWVAFLAAFFFATDACRRYAAFERSRAASASVLGFTSRRSVTS